MITVAANCEYPVLIVGETGVGKEIVARCIHDESLRREKAMIVADSAATAESLLESEFFGHKKGSFTGAHVDHVGYCERADGSTLFLDELDSMPLRVQAALLRVLETGEYRPVGAEVQLRSDFRLVSAALPRLMKLVDDGGFREDLFYRISTLRIEIPPLRERPEDAEQLADLRATELGVSLSVSARSVIAGHKWPGNVRQLLHAVQVASLAAKNGDIGADELSRAIGTNRVPARAGQVASAADAAWSRVHESLERLPNFGAWEFAAAAGVSRRTAQRYLARLLQNGRISRLGAGRATRYGARGLPNIRRYL